MVNFEAIFLQILFNANDLMNHSLFLVCSRKLHMSFSHELKNDSYDLGPEKYERWKGGSENPVKESF